jgi:hypothetical protein
MERREPLHGLHSDPERLTWAYYERVKAAAERFGTINEPSVVEHLARLERDIKRRQLEDRD